MNIFKFRFLICKYNFSPGLQYDKQNIHGVGIRKFSLFHNFCFAVVQLPGPTRLQIAWVVNFSQDHIKILGNYILSFQMTKKHTKIHGLKYYLPKILKLTTCLWQLSLENKKLVPDFIYPLSLPYQESHLQVQGCQDLPLHYSEWKIYFVIRQQAFSDKRINGVAQACQWSHNFRQLLKNIYSDKKASSYNSSFFKSTPGMSKRRQSTSPPDRIILCHLWNQMKKAKVNEMLWQTQRLPGSPAIPE